MTTRSWHSMNVNAAIKELQVDPLSGLAPEEAAKRPSQYGANELAQQEKASPWAFFKRNAGLRVTIKGIL